MEGKKKFQPDRKLKLMESGLQKDMKVAFYAI
jgi:hypothetical protein